MPERKIYDNITFFSVYKWLASMVQMRGSRNFHQGGGRVQVSLTKKPRQRFFLVLSLFYRSQMVNFKEIYCFSRLQMGSNFFSRGSNFFQGVSNCLFPIETHLICDFTEGVRTPCPPPSGSPLGAALTASWLRLLYIISFGLGKR